MKVFITLLCVAAASAQYWTPYSGIYHPTMYTMPLVKPIKPIEYTKTVEYKTGMPLMYSNLYNNWYPYHKLAEMPKPETDYASKGEYRAEAAGGVVHVAKRSAEPFWYNNHWGVHPASTTYAATPFTTYAATPFTPYAATPFTPYAAHPLMTYSHYPYTFPTMPKMVHDDREKAEETPEYANKGEYRAESAGVVHLAKRSADAQQILLRSSSIIPTTYNTIPYTTYNTAAFNGINTPFYNNINAPFYNNIYSGRYINSAYRMPYYL